MNNYSPKQIVAELDRYIIGQQSAKKAVAVALRNRYRRSKLPEYLKEEITPKNIIMPVMIDLFIVMCIIAMHDAKIPIISRIFSKFVCYNV